jgi:hypothetical protein
MTTEPKPRRAVVGLRVTNSGPVPVRVQYLGKGVPVYPEFAVQPGGSHVTVYPPGFDEDVQLWSSRPRIGRFIKIEHVFWLDGIIHAFPKHMLKSKESAR